MGYYEVNNQPYPAVLDCKGTSIYDASGLTPSGPDLTTTGTFIRHHRMPDCGGDAESYGAQDNDMGLTKRTVDGITGERAIELNKIALVVDLTDVYTAIGNADPDLRSKIKGHYIVYGKRDEINKTIVDKGYM
jgi:hypothetical protein